MSITSKEKYPHKSGVKIGEYIQFIVYYKLDEAFMDGEVTEVLAWDGETSEPIKEEDYLDFMIKWDGCSHVNFGEVDDNDERDAYLHLCGAGSWKDHCTLMESLYKMACTLGVVRLDGEEWE